MDEKHEQAEVTISTIVEEPSVELNSESTEGQVSEKPKYQDTSYLNYTTKEESPEHVPGLSRPVTMDGDTKPIKEWCRIYGISFPLFLDRIKRGFDVETAITKPARNYRSQKWKAELQEMKQEQEYYDQPLEIMADREPKFLACRRLKEEGRYWDFRSMIATIKENTAHRISKTEAFYEALKFFPPIETYKHGSNRDLSKSKAAQKASSRRKVERIRKNKRRDSVCDEQCDSE